MDPPTPDTAGAPSSAADVEPQDSHIAELTRTRDAAIEAATGERERTAVAIQQCDYLASEILAERRRHGRELAGERDRHAQELASVREHLAGAATRADDEARRLEHRLTHALATIRNMERSRFWQTRLLWVRIRKAGWR